MTREEYFSELEQSIIRIFEDNKFDNNTKQMFSWRVGVKFNKTYDEDFIWRRALFLSSNACTLLKQNPQNKVAVKALKLSAEIYEYLSEITEKFDKDYCYILSALCYDISGYQANALCMMRNLLQKTNQEFYLVETEGESLNTNLSDENYILFHIQLILLKKIPHAYLSNKKSVEWEKENNSKCEDYIGISLFDKAIYGLYEHILNGYENTFLGDIDNAYKYYLKIGNVFISHLLHLLNCRFQRYKERSIWNNLFPVLGNNSEIWGKYIRLLSNDLYKRFAIKKPKERQSIFEFWISQLRAVQQGVLNEHESFIIQMPTSAGKTFIAEIAILDNLLRFPNKKCIYVAPFRALTNEKEIEIAHNISKLGYSVSSLSGAYEIDEFQNFILESTDVLIATPEKLDLLYRLQTTYFEGVSLLIIDEGHIIGDVSERAALLEFLIIRLKRKLPKLKILFISAVMPPENGTEFSNWISSKSTNVIKSPFHIENEIWQPTRKLIGKFEWVSKEASRITYPSINLQEESSKSKIVPFVTNLIKSEKYGRRTFPKKTSRGQTAIALAYKLSEKGNTLIFCPRPDWALSVGKAFLDFIEILLKANYLILNQFGENEKSASYYSALKWLGEDDIVTKCVKRGVGIHYGDLPEPVRKSIEKDYRKGNLRMLISTNTIGQGLNFPIKSLIIHSLDINPQAGTRIEIRDFWNIIGRAGRAGKETEGQIIFLALKPKDHNRFDEYININNIKNVKSLFSLLVDALINNRITKDVFSEYLSSLSEPFLLSILAEEIVETDDEELINQIIDNSLFKVQVLDVTPLKKGFSTIIQRIKDSIPEKKRLKSFASNGFNLESNTSLEKFILQNLERLKVIIENDNYEDLLSEILKVFDIGEIKEIQFNEKLEELNGQVSNLHNFILEWIDGKDISSLYQIWTNCVPEKLEKRRKMFVFLSQGLTYRLPWGITAFLTVLTHYLDIPLENLPTNIQSLSGYIKYGMKNKLGCFALSLGIRSRELSNLIVDKYGGNDNYQVFMNWLANLTKDEILNWSLSEIETENIYEVALKFNAKKFKTKIPSKLKFRIRGIYYSEEARQNSLLVQIDEKLSYKRDVENEYDPFAIKILSDSGDKFLGYIPRELSKPLSVVIDLKEKDYKLNVINIIPKNEYNDIVVQMDEKK